jgi:hypothetical protein
MVVGSREVKHGQAKSIEGGWRGQGGQVVEDISLDTLQERGAALVHFLGSK